MDPPRTDTGAPVRHANTYSDVGDHVAFGVDPPCDRQFFSFLSPVVCSVTGPPRESLKLAWLVVVVVLFFFLLSGPGKSPRDRTALPEHRAKTVGR